MTLFVTRWRLISTIPNKISSKFYPFSNCVVDLIYNDIVVKWRLGRIRVGGEHTKTLYKIKNVRTV